MGFVLGVVFDIDHTMRNWRDDATIEEMEWNGEKHYWKNLCASLKQICNECEVDIYFGIATAKEVVDDLVIQAVDCLQKYLIVPDQDNKEQWLVQNNEWTVCVDEKHYNISDDAFSETDKPTCVYVTKGKSKAAALEKIQALYQIKLPEYVTLLDDNLDVGADVMARGFSFVSAEKINAGENSPAQRDIETLNAIHSLIKEVMRQLIQLKLSYLSELIALNSPAFIIKTFCYTQIAEEENSASGYKKISLLKYIVDNEIALLEKLLENKIFTLAEVKKAVPDCMQQISRLFETQENTVVDFSVFNADKKMSGSDTASVGFHPQRPRSITN